MKHRNQSTLNQRFSNLMDFFFKIIIYFLERLWEGEKEGDKRLRETSTGCLASAPTREPHDLALCGTQNPTNLAALVRTQTLWTSKTS